jgi:hypothetical protein
MRAREFITENEGKIHHNAKSSSRGVIRVRDPDSVDRMNHLNRLAMAMACADGRSKKAIQGMDAYSWAQKYNTVHPYTEEENNMLHQAMKTVPTKHSKTVPYSKSQEPDEINVTSPVTGFKGYE